MTAARAMPALSDDEDGPPNLPPRLRIMPNDQDESRNALTTPAPPPSEPATRAENEKPEPRIAMNPAPLTNPFAEPPPWWEGSFFQATFNKMQSGFEALSKAAAGQDEILAAIQRADSNSTRNYELIRDEIRHLKDSDLKQDERLKQGDKRFEQIERSVEALKVELIARIESEMRVFVEKFQALERLLAEAKANDPARPATPTPGA